MLSLRSMPQDSHRKFSLQTVLQVLLHPLRFPQCSGQLPASQRGSVCCCQWERDWALSRVSEILFRSQESAAWKSVHTVSWHWRRDCAIAVPSSTNSKSDISKNSSVLGSAPFVIQGEILTLSKGNMAHPQFKAVWEPHPFLQAVEWQSPAKWNIPAFWCSLTTLYKGSYAYTDCLWKIHPEFHRQQNFAVSKSFFAFFLLLWELFKGMEVTTAKKATEDCFYNLSKLIVA